MKILLIGIFSVLLLACDGDPYSGFGCIAQEGHTGVAHARSLPQERLEFLYHEIRRLRKLSTDTRIEYRVVQSAENIKPIPDNLEFINAQRILPDSNLIILADCMDEHIDLRFSDSAGQPEIILSWAAPTIESPYNSKSQVLWPKAE